MENKKRVLVIDPFEKKIYGGTYQGFTCGQKIVGGLIERACVLKGGAEIYVNEEGLFGNPQHFFGVDLGPGKGRLTFAGKGYLIGRRTHLGGNATCTWSVPELEKQITFLNARQLTDYLKYGIAAEYLR